MTTIEDRPKRIILINDVMLAREEDKLIKIFNEDNKLVAEIPRDSWRNVKNFFEDILND